jgi:predicted transcriptional regulator
MEDAQRPTAIHLACRIVGAYVSNNAISPDGVLEMLQGLLEASEGFRNDVVAAEPERQVGAPAVPIEESVHPDYIVCLEDGQRFKSLRRHLTQKYGMTPDAYRARWGLPHNYPMVAPNYAKVRSQIAKAREQQKRERLVVHPLRARPKSPSPRR